MSLLVKDHKEWKESDNKPVPTRPVLSGNTCLNTHLSELVSELLEPISTRINSAEVTSTEEALMKITELNKLIRKGGDWTDKEKFNVLNIIGQDDNFLADLLDDLNIRKPHKSI